MNKLSIVRIASNQHFVSSLDIELHSFSDQTKALKSLWGLLCKYSEKIQEIDGQIYTVYNITIAPTHLVNDKTDWDKEKIDGASQTILRHYPFEKGLPEITKINSTMKNTVYPNEEAINWWRALSKEERDKHCSNFIKANNLAPVSDSIYLLGEEIKQIWDNVIGLKEPIPRIVSKLKDFSLEEKKEAFKVIFAELSESEKFALINSSGVIDWYKKNCY